MQADNPWDAPEASTPSPVLETAKEEAVPPKLDAESLSFTPSWDAAVDTPAVTEEDAEEDSREEEGGEETWADSIDEVATRPPIDEEGPPMDSFDVEDSPVVDALAEDTGFDEFDDDFGEMGDVVQEGEDDFGDFEDTVEEEVFAPVASTSTSAHPPLRLDLSNPTAAALAPQLSRFVDDLYPTANNYLTDEIERQVDGVAQVLVTEPLRNLLMTLSSLPPLRPLDWRRSRIRREHLITLGVPINLDDSAETAPLASLVLPSQLSLRPPPAASPSTAFQYSPSMTPSQSRPQTPITTAPPPPRQVVPVAPTINRARIEEIVKIGEEDLLLMGLGELRKLQGELVELSRDASGLLTFELMRREKEVTDSETYGTLIADLVAASAKMKTTTNRASTPTNSSSGSRWSRK